MHLGVYFQVRRSQYPGDKGVYAMEIILLVVLAGAFIASGKILKKYQYK